METQQSLQMSVTSSCFGNEGHIISIPEHRSVKWSRESQGIVMKRLYNAAGGKQYVETGDALLSKFEGMELSVVPENQSAALIIFSEETKKAEEKNNEGVPYKTVLREGEKNELSILPGYLYALRTLTKIIEGKLIPCVGSGVVLPFTENGSEYRLIATYTANRTYRIDADQLRLGASCPATHFVAFFCPEAVMVA